MHMELNEWPELASWVRSSARSCREVGALDFGAGFVGSMLN